MGANQDSLTALQTQQAALASDYATLNASVQALIALVGSGGGGGTPVNDDIAAGVQAVTADLSTLEASMQALNAQVAAATATPQPVPGAPVSSPEVS